jgi:prepilin-type processing-associated H-X9-DG protein
LAWLDSLVALAAGIIFLSFLLPTIWRWRESARQISCAENLRNLGVALTGFADFSPQHRFPAINTSGPLTFAGVYAIRLQDASLLDSTKWLHCPSNDYIDFPMSVPTSSEFLTAAPDQQRIWRYVVGGNYAYNLGNLVNGKYQSPRSDSPVRVALVGDMWPKTLGAIDNVGSPIVLHGDRGANILYSDGSTQWIRIPDQVQGLAVDHPFLNADLEQGVGRGLNDACLAPSYWLPAADLPGHEFKPVEIDRNR